MSSTAGFENSGLSALILFRTSESLNAKDFSALVNTYAEKAYKDSTLAF